MMQHDWLATTWFVVIAVLWTGYFPLEGFDFGVGILLPVIGRDDGQRRIVVNSIGPFWDANEVWLIVAGGATFPAFPEWYDSGFHLPLLGPSLILRPSIHSLRSEGAGPMPEGCQLDASPRSTGSPVASLQSLPSTSDFYVPAPPADGRPTL
jgi:cytochrome d oxidase subunit CydB